MRLLAKVTKQAKKLDITSVKELRERGQQSYLGRQTGRKNE